MKILEIKPSTNPNKKTRKQKMMIEVEANSELSSMYIASNIDLFFNAKTMNNRNLEGIRNVNFHHGYINDCVFNECLMYFHRICAKNSDFTSESKRYFNANRCTFMNCNFTNMDIYATDCDFKDCTFSSCEGSIVGCSVADCHFEDTESCDSRVLKVRMFNDDYNKKTSFFGNTSTMNNLSFTICDKTDCNKNYLWSSDIAMIDFEDNQSFQIAFNNEEGRVFVSKEEEGFVDINSLPADIKSGIEEEVCRMEK